MRIAAAAQSTAVESAEARVVETTRAALLDFLTQGSETADALGLGESERTKEPNTRERTEDINDRRDSRQRSTNRLSEIACASVADWWHQQPLRSGALIAEYAVTRYTRRHPLPAMMISLAVGSALVWARPWRMVSMTAIGAGLLRSPRATDIAVSVLEAATRLKPRDRR